MLFNFQLIAYLLPKLGQTNTLPPNLKLRPQSSNPSQSKNRVLRSIERWVNGTVNQDTEKIRPRTHLIFLHFSGVFTNLFNTVQLLTGQDTDSHHSALMSSTLQLLRRSRSERKRWFDGAKVCHSEKSKKFISSKRSKSDVFSVLKVI
jgi:hypothetical protein